MENRIGAVWARVSTEPQQSLDSQAARAKTELEKKGYIVPPDRILKVDWTSLDLFNCPQFKKLREWIKNGEIAALGILDRDRLNAQGLQRLVFLSECKEHGVELVLGQGPEILNEPEGQLVELALAIGKERQVLRAQQGSKDALRERATVKGLPTTCQAPYGYHWDESRTKLIANGGWQTRFLIANMFLNGATLKGIAKELAKRGIPSPKGRHYWPEPTLSYILRDTVNYGEYRALRRENIEPKERRGDTYGKSSSRYHEGIHLPNIAVEKPVISKEEQGWVIERLERNRVNARRNAKREYLLRGMIQYEGDPGHRYTGADIRHISWAYRYTVRGGGIGDNPRSYLPGRKLEKVVEDKAREILTSDDVLENELGLVEKTIKESAARQESELKRLERKLTENANAESELVGLRIRSKVSDQAYERQLSLLSNERKWITEEVERTKASLANLQKESSSLVGLKQLRTQMEARLSSPDFADRRFVLEALGTRVVVTTEGAIDVEFGIPNACRKEYVTAFNAPLNACPRY